MHVGHTCVQPLLVMPAHVLSLLGHNVKSYSALITQGDWGKYAIRYADCLFREKSKMKMPQIWH